MHRIQLIHWNAAQANERAARLRAAGYQVRCDVPSGPGFLSELRKDPPLAVVIDLDRRPSVGRDIAVAIRHAKATRSVALVFTGGDPMKVARIQEILPDALCTTWSRIRSSLKHAIAHPPADPVVPQSVFAGYSGTPLAKKLGIKANSVVCLAGAPRSFRRTLGELPGGAVLREQDRGPCDLVIWFTRSGDDLKSRIKAVAARAGRAPLWIAWPKQASGMATDLSQQRVREVGLATGLVDYKICAIDATWSGLLFTQRKSKKH